MLIAYWPLVILVIGVLIWALASNAILKEIGRWMFIIGLFFTVQALAQKTVKVGSMMKTNRFELAQRAGPDLKLQRG
jgi:Na+/phosphate symporter